jgi:acyl-CoA synthetase (NDP forming)
MSSVDIIDRAKNEGRTILTEVESKQILEEAGIPTARAQLAASRDQAIAAAKQLGFPVVLKIVSPDISHKSDVGGVKLNLRSEDEVGAAFDEIMAAAPAGGGEPKAKIEGVSVQKMASPGVEVIMGMTKDAQFGPVLMFGLGGVFVEVLKDVAFRIVPLEPRDASQMIREIQGFPVLQGFRGQEPADLAALEGMLLRLSAFVEEHPEIAELDLNPIFAYKDGALAVDARIVLS